MTKENLQKRETKRLRTGMRVLPQINKNRLIHTKSTTETKTALPLPVTIKIHVIAMITRKIHVRTIVNGTTAIGTQTVIVTANTANTVIEITATGSRTHTRIEAMTATGTTPDPVTQDLIAQAIVKADEIRHVRERVMEHVRVDERVGDVRWVRPEGTVKRRRDKRIRVGETITSVGVKIGGGIYQNGIKIPLRLRQMVTF